MSVMELTLWFVWIPGRTSGHRQWKEERIDFSACPLWQGVQGDNSRIYIFLYGKMLYVVENFL